MSNAWSNEFDTAYQETLRLLDEFEKDGFPYKRAAQIRFENCQYPSWEGLTETEGVVKIDPTKHAPRAIAHEMGHGFHECLRRDHGEVWKNQGDEGQMIAEAIRYFVEVRMNSAKGKSWSPNPNWAQILEACNYTLDGPFGFRALLRNGWSVDTLRRMRATGRQILGCVVFLVLAFTTAGLGSVATTPNIATWYAGLAKPIWNPPNWLFGPVWTVLYICMAVAAWLVWRKGGLAKARWPLALFAVQLVLNAAWSWIFFGFHMPGAAFVEIVALLVAIAATTIAFWRQSLAAGVLMVPYLAWVAFATVLNFTIWRLNV